MKKILSVVLVCVLLLSAVAVFPFGASAVVKRSDLGDVIMLGDFDSVVKGYLVFYPEELETTDKTYPVAVWGNGTACLPSLYTDLLKAVAARGYIVVTSSDVMAKDGTGMIGEIDYILDECLNPESVFCGKVDPTKIAAFGHSQGGAGAVNAAKADPRIGCIASIAGASTGSECQTLNTPALFLSGEADLVVLSKAWVEPSYKAAAGPAAYAQLKGALHTACISSKNIDSYAYYITEWFNLWLGYNGNADIFQKGGKLDKDSAWQNMTSKNVYNPYANGSEVGSVFAQANVWALVAMGELLVIVICVFVIIAQNKRRKNNAH